MLRGLHGRGADAGSRGVEAANGRDILYAVRILGLPFVDCGRNAALALYELVTEHFLPCSGQVQPRAIFVTEWTFVIRDHDAGSTIEAKRSVVMGTAPKGFAETCFYSGSCLNGRQIARHALPVKPPLPCMLMTSSHRASVLMVAMVTVSSQLKRSRSQSD